MPEMQEWLKRTIEAMMKGESRETFASKNER